MLRGSIISLAFMVYLAFVPLAAPVPPRAIGVAILAGQGSPVRIAQSVPGRMRCSWCRIGTCLCIRSWLAAVLVTQYNCPRMPDLEGVVAGVACQNKGGIVPKWARFRMGDWFEHTGMSSSTRSRMGLCGLAGLCAGRIAKLAEPERGHPAETDQPSARGAVLQASLLTDSFCGAFRAYSLGSTPKCSWKTLRKCFRSEKPTA